ncbi:polysaccharide biosynthesis tyrosine autokinase [Marinobacterium jannaschii]|uniref:polysaccharide biosynthesis tyrosine autokinase n=1 Tax=Marinobacterium jannaschii TaxID=64970 RepID=UPI000484B850|nr:polysaccharide biosynthesis tyrosine autokinase [Marinobacterium jannaschii]
MTVQPNIQPVSNKSSTSDSDEIDLGRLLGILAGGKWTIATITLLAALIGIAVAVLSTPVYRADALIQVEEKSSGIPGLGDMGDLFSQESSSGTEVEVIRSRFVLGQAVEQGKLAIVAEPKRFPIIGEFLARRYGRAVPAEPLFGLGLLKAFAWGGEQIEIDQLHVEPALQGKQMTLIAGDAGAFQLQDSEGVLLLKGQVGEVAESTPAGVAVLLTKLEARTGTEFLVKRKSKLQAINGLRAGLSVSEKGKGTGILSLALTGVDVQQIRTSLNHISTLYQLQNVNRLSAEASNSLTFLQEQLPKVKQDLEQAEQRLNSFRKDQSSVDLTLETQSYLEQLVQVDASLNELDLKEAELSRKFTRQHPVYVTLLQQKQELIAQKELLSGKVQQLPETQREILALTRDVEAGIQVYTQLLNKMQELNIVKAGTVGNVRILDDAAVVSQPIKPKKSLIVVLAIVLGLMLAVAIVLVKGMLRSGVESSEVIEAETGLAVYATVPNSADQQKLNDQLEKLKRSQGLLAVENPADLAIESLRGLRTSLHFAMMEAKNNVVSISGPSPGVGKSFISANLAAVMAGAGQKVLVIDGDMRKGHMQQAFGAERHNGLSEILCGDLMWQQVVISTEQPGLDFISTGSIPPNPSELLMHPRFEALIEEVSRAYDLVLIDTPPIMAVTDAAIVGKLSAATLMVVRFGLNPVKEIAAAQRRFEQNGIRINGCILNGIERKTGGYGYGYYNYEYK